MRQNYFSMHKKNRPKSVFGGQIKSHEEIKKLTKHIEKYEKEELENFEKFLEENSENFWKK